MRRYDLKTKITKSLYKLVPQQGVKIGDTIGGGGLFHYFLVAQVQSILIYGETYKITENNNILKIKAPYPPHTGVRSSKILSLSFGLGVVYVTKTGAKYNFFYRNIQDIRKKDFSKCSDPLNAACRPNNKKYENMVYGD